MVAFEIKTIKSEAKRVPKPFEPFGLYQVKIEEPKLVTEIDSALNNNELLSTNHGNLMLPDSVIATPSTSADIRKHRHFHEFYISVTLQGCIGSSYFFYQF